MRVQTVAAACATAVVVSLVTPTPTAAATVLPQAHVPVVQLSALATASAPAVAQADPIVSGVTTALRTLAVQVGAWITSVGNALMGPAYLLAIPLYIVDPQAKNPFTQLVYGYAYVVQEATKNLAKLFGYPPATAQPAAAKTMPVTRSAKRISSRAAKVTATAKTNRPTGKTNTAASAPHTKADKGTGRAAPRGKKTN